MELTKEQLKIRNNALTIAKFEGYETESESTYGNIFYSDDNERTAIDTAYHSLWEWIMPVVQKINRIDNDRYTVKIMSMDVEIYDNITGQTLVDTGCKYQPEELIESVYEAVVSFIKLYNDNNKKEFEVTVKFLYSSKEDTKEWEGKPPYRFIDTIEKARQTAYHQLETCDTNLLTLEVKEV